MATPGRREAARHAAPSQTEGPAPNVESGTSSFSPRRIQGREGAGEAKAEDDDEEEGETAAVAAGPPSGPGERAAPRFRV